MKRLTITEIAALAQSSPATVSRVLNGHPSVSPDMRERVLHVIDENGYVPNASARNLARRRSGVIGLLVPREPSGVFSPGYMSAIIPAMIERCNERGYLLNLSTAHGQDLQRDFHQRVVRSGHVDGVVVLDPEMDEPILPLLIKDGAPFVMFGRHAYLHNITWVDDDNLEGAHMAVSHLIHLGYQRIAILITRRNAAFVIDRLDGYKRTLVESGFTVDPDLVAMCDSLKRSDGRLATLALLDLAEPPDAIFAAGDALAGGALDALHERGLAVPGDVGLVAYGDFPTGIPSTSSLTTVRQPSWEIAGAAIDLLIDHIEDPGRPPEHKVFPVQLVVRGSCGANLRSQQAQGREETAKEPQTRP